GATFADGATEVFVAGDGWFLGVALAVGLPSGALTWLVARGSGPYAVLGLAVGGALAAYVAAKVGRRIGQAELRAAAAAGIPGTYVANVPLQATQVVLAWPRGQHGRKYYSGTCLYAADGRLLAQAEAVWISVNAATVRPM
ncbi:MAG: hypothetical protein IMZ75_15665, partial [Actinobacteria bacterium]|nr:hypothetical protein [Actinomycetota bacterium]